MGETLNELRESYERFLRNERYDLVDRIVTAIDDLEHLGGGSGGGGNADDESPNDRRRPAGPRVPIRLAELRSIDVQLSQRLRFDPLRHLRALEAACHSIAQQERPKYDVYGQTIRVGLVGPVGAVAVSPRQLTSSSLRQIVCVEGVATKVSTIKPKVVQSVHYCPATKMHQSKDYVDATDPNLGLQAVDAQGDELADRVINITSSVYPSRDAEGRDLETEFGLSTFKDHQTITLQEMPEKAPMGQLPRSVELILDHDLVDRIKPGDRVMITGVYRALANNATQGQQMASGVFRTVVLVNNVQILGRDVSTLQFTAPDVRAIRQMSQADNILDILGRSIAPSIYGHAIIKKALALQLLSGVEKNLDNGTHLRGDINILMVGDPSTAKSQLLRSSMTIAPLAVSTTGKGSSGVGLTAAVTTDPDTRERRLEAGAMVLADSGLVCVDEFDKMGENDRVAIHEAMEQQTVTIAKAGIHASLNARCSVLAAANPVYGQYDRRKRIQENIGLPDSLLSRFDLLFVVLDQIDPESDRRIASHVVRGHRYRSDAPGEDDESDDDDEDDLQQVHNVWQRSRHATGTSSSNANDVLQHDFLRKYIHFAKTRIKPVLTESSRDFIANRYAEMRARQDERTLPITARSLETVIRMATAHAKARLSDVVEAEPDCQVAMDILSFALYHENASPSTTKSTSSPAKSPTSALDAPLQPQRPESDDERTPPLPPNKRHKMSSALATRIWNLLQEHDGMIDLADLEDDDGITPEGLQVALDELTAGGKVMVDAGYALLV